MDGLPLLESGQPWVWPDGTPVRVWGPCPSTSIHPEHLFRAPHWASRHGEAIVECPGYPAPLTREDVEGCLADLERRVAWEKHVEDALDVTRG